MTEATKPRKGKRKKDSIAFSFGDPEWVLGSQITDYLGTVYDSNQEYYTPPLSPSGLVKVTGANAHHGSCIYFKRNLLVRQYRPNQVLPLMDLNAAALDFEILGNCYLQTFSNHLGQIVRLAHLPAVNMRRGQDTAGQTRYCLLKKNGGKVWFNPGEVLHVAEYEPLQQIYGQPQYMGGLQSALLSEDATLFRRRYYQNGSHMGFIFYTNDPNLDSDTEKKLKQQIRAGKGVGNFRSMFINIPNGAEKAVQIIPVGDIAQRDEFERIKRISADEVLVAHRMQPSLAGVKPDNTGGFGDIEKISRVYIQNEIGPKAMVFMEAINQHLPAGRKIAFDIPD